MRRFFVLILAFLYLGTSLGAGINLHYCMGKLVDTSFFADDNDSCSRCGMEMSAGDDNDCCKDEHKHVKVQDEHKSASLLLFQLHPDGVALASTPYELPHVFVASVALDNPNSHAPPGCAKIGYQILYCSFLI